MPPPGAPEVIGGWILARYGGNGESKGIVRLSQAVRLILGADTSRVLLLLSTGGVGEVQAW
jgi:hypothetical protein